MWPQQASWQSAREKFVLQENFLQAQCMTIEVSEMYIKIIILNM